MISRPAGFTIIELLITIAIMAILMAVAAPSVRDLNRNARMTAQTNDLMTDMAIARAEAAKRGVHTAICTSSDGATCTATAWNQGWIIFLDADGNGALAAAADIVKASPAIDGWSDLPIPNTIVATGTPLPVGGANWIGYRPSGVAKLGAGFQAATFDLCDARTTAAVGVATATNKGRRITVSQTGRAFSVRCTCPDLTVCNP